MPPTRGPESLSPEWFAARKNGFGSSEAAKIIGVSEWGTALDVYCEKQGLVPAFEGNKSTRRGRRVEPLIVEDWQDETGRKVEVYPAGMFISTEHPFQFATPDGIVRLETEGLECKSTTWRQAQKFGEEGSDNIPDDWNIQAQHQMAVMGWQVVHFCVWIDFTPHIFQVPRNDDIIEAITAAESELWQRIQNCDPPPPDFEHDHTPKLLRALYDVVEGTTIDLPPEIAAVWEEQAKLGETERDAKERREKLRAQVQYAMGDHAVGRLPGGLLEIARGKVHRREYTVAATSYITLRERKVKAKR